MALNPTALTKYSLQHLVTGEPEGACLTLASSYMSSSVLSNNQASMIVSNKTRSLLTYVTHVCYLYMILYLDIVIAKFVLSLLLLQTLAAFVPSNVNAITGS